MVNKKKTCGKSDGMSSASLPLFSVDDCFCRVPAAGWRNGTSLNNVGENGNYWSSTPNESDTQNAYNLNFNSSNYDWNWNNRNNGHSVRPVSELTPSVEEENNVRRFSISKEQLLLDLFQAYKDARKHKRKRVYQLKFEFELEENLIALRDELLAGAYRPRSSTCFIIHDPKMREVFAAEFRDRIVHHLFYNYTHELFERTFIYDSYSCIQGRGTHMGIKRLLHHIRSVSCGFSTPCYILKIDIRGYFMNINREKLLQICRKTLEKMRKHSSNVSGMRWDELLDFQFVDYLLETIIRTDPIEQCNMLGRIEDWRSLPREKSLFYTQSDCGLPIGNLSSQLFSNIYMNVFDQYVKRVLGCRHYGRYVDDAYVVSKSRLHLKSLIPLVADFLSSELGLTIHPSKVRIVDINEGVEFLGAYIKPFRTYISSASLKRMKRKIPMLHHADRARREASINSFLGVLSHYKSYGLRRVLFGYTAKLNKYGSFDKDWLVFHSY